MSTTQKKEILQEPRKLCCVYTCRFDNQVPNRQPTWN